MSDDRPAEEELSGPDSSRDRAERDSTEAGTAREQFEKNFPAHYRLKIWPLIVLIVGLVLIYLCYLEKALSGSCGSEKALLAGLVALLGTVVAVWVSLGLRDEYQAGRETGLQRRYFEQEIILRREYPTESKSPLARFAHSRLLAWSLLVAVAVTALLIIPFLTG